MGAYSLGSDKDIIEASRVRVPDLFLWLADYGYVLETGTITFDGLARDLLRSERVRHAYLGEQ